MSKMKSFAVFVVFVASVALGATDASAQRRGGGGSGGGGGHRGPSGSGSVVGHGSPRVGPGPSRGVGPSRGYYPSRVIGSYPYRPYYYGYRPGLTVGFYGSFGSPYYYGYYGYPYDYTYFDGYGYGYGYYPYGAVAPYRYAVPRAYVTAVPGYSYGGVRIQGAPEDAQVFVDGYYMGIVDDFDGAFQHLNLQSGPHRIEIRPQGLPPASFDVNVTPGQTVTYHAGIR